MNWPTRIVLVAGLALLATGCKKPKPSPEYAQAQATHSSLYAERLEDAYTDPRMVAVEDQLRTVPADSADHQAATALLAKIASERARMTAENEARSKAIAEALKPAVMPPSTEPYEPIRAPVEPTAPPPAEGPVDASAGPKQPGTGMSAADFHKHFSGCFTQGPPAELAGHGLCETYELKDIANCRDRHPAYVNSMVVVGEQKVLALSPKSSMQLKVRLPDGGLGDPAP